MYNHQIQTVDLTSGSCFICMLKAVLSKVCDEKGANTDITALLLARVNYLNSNFLEILS